MHSLLGACISEDSDEVTRGLTPSTSMSYVYLTLTTNLWEPGRSIELTLHLHSTS